MPRWNGSKSTALAMAGLLLGGATACGVDSDGSDASSGAPSELIIAVSAPMSDPIYSQVVAGFETRLEIANEDGEVDGHTFKVESRDNKATPEGGATTVQSLLAENPFAMMVQGSGSYSSAAELLKNQSPNLPILGVASAGVIKQASLPNGFGLYNDYVRDCYLDVEYLAEEHDVSNVAIVYQDDALGQQAGEECPAYAESLGLEATSVPVAPATTEFGSVAAKVRDTGADGVVMVSLAPMLAGLQTAAEKISFRPTWVTVSSSATAANLFIPGTYVTNWLRPLSSTEPEVEEFKAAMQEYAPDAETPLGASGWTMAEVLIEAVKSSVDGGELTQEALLAELKKFERPDGIAMAPGSMSYVEDQSTLVNSLTMNEWNGTELVEVTEPRPLPTGE
jgi:branched-chain amino acid transport system substrate-binding protein